MEIAMAIIFAIIQIKTSGKNYVARPQLWLKSWQELWQEIKYRPQARFMALFIFGTNFCNNSNIDLGHELCSKAATLAL